MLKGLDPLLGPDLLAGLRGMGHGDEIAIVDANFPAESNARRLIRVDGADAVAALRAILSVLPLDNFGLDAAFRMSVTGAPEQEPPVCAAFGKELARVGYSRAMAALDRHAFYARARGAFAIVATGERRLWGNILLIKGALAPSDDEN